ncbi:MAG: helix-turn-helix transcriptional regulator [Ruminococcaceae bacterium]|nr:helix-turn-helix transcriptional regulator [Oscillospiraceae bacterium]
MDQVKIGKFIAERRKAANLTQMQLAEKLQITDRAISKWETGRAMPDSSLMLELCELLGITVNDLLCGEVVRMGNQNKETEKTLLDMLEQKENNDRWLLKLELVIGILCMAIMLTLIVIASLAPIEHWLRFTLIGIGVTPILIALPFLLRIEQVAGYYECKNCKHRYIPTCKAVNMAPHLGRSRYMCCPQCGEKSYHKKVLTKE